MYGHRARLFKTRSRSYVIGRCNNQWERTECMGRAKHLPAATTSLTEVQDEPSKDGHFPQCALNLRLQDRVPCTFTEYRCVFICESFAHRFGLSGCLLARGSRRSCVMSSANLCFTALYSYIPSVFLAEFSLDGNQVVTLCGQYIR